MYIEVNESYKFEFIEDFNALNGFYKVVQKMTYDEMLEANVDMANGLYALVNKTEQDWARDADSYRDGFIYKIEELNSEFETKILYVPELILNGAPDANIHKYGKLSLMVNLGAFKDPEQLSSLIIDIKNILETNYGITNEPIVSIYDKVWMSDMDYSYVELARNMHKGTVVNYYSEALKLSQELIDQKARCEALEQIIINNNL